MRRALVALLLSLLVTGGAAASPRKPAAPVDVRLQARPLGGDAWEVTLVATPRRAVTGLVLELDGQRVRVGALGAGASRVVRARVTVAGGAGRDVVGSASVDVGGHRRRAAASARLGAPPKAPPPARIVRLPDGTEAAEVRP